ncbi:uncharacterized protein B0T23DRAFT_187276 [Neurospora hispaniola]|uniref:Uncharacterized protein n=1 Tax=Neurospora hispaniola TaxID=588809 RepID=A0AAJ0I368_9PEZI|nr:hypothetical protein B0T23DRAFT_187276 [Neurospora hispaniola]
MLYRMSVCPLLVMGKSTSVHGAVIWALMRFLCQGIKDDGALRGASWFLYPSQRTTTLKRCGIMLMET